MRLGAYVCRCIQMYLYVHVVEAGTLLEDLRLASCAFRCVNGIYVWYVWMYVCMYISFVNALRNLLFELRK